MRALVVWCLTSFFLLTAATMVQAAPQPSETERIDSAYISCIERAGEVTFELRDCAGEASKKMDKRLNAVYQELLSKLPPEKQAVLRNAQRQWLTYAKAERDLSFALDPSEGGTAQLVNLDAFAYDQLKNRVLQFERFLADLEL
ncbi:lysozyme inhibitor LprI family protein [Geomesophilobacter sediminis]|uniref:DUF1311 domain-containing protein n=1 Tax=Geomesophilobacter sediminis TaxID=2798584 RepID=A0A8J7LYU6_9BACT|nr:lysozyme inhibitor LprI family protein [Geomesophilobacter sediminis]MBJ6725581.1 DUF1311 domain-containing protein [Geomesophilobacter sediminis]